MKPAAPPRLVAWLLERSLPDGDRSATMLGDLHEEFGRRAGRSLGSARVWYVREAMGIALRYSGRARARRALGPEPRTHGPTTPGGGGVDMFATNLRYAVRRLRRSPSFTLIAVLSLGLGIGANTAMFSLVNAVVLRAQPFEDPETLVDVYEASDGFSHGTLSYPDYLDLLEGSAGVFEDVAGSQFTMLRVDGADGVDVVTAEAVTGNYFPLFGVEPAVGRLLSAQDHVAPGAHPVVVLGSGFWERRFGRAPSAVGSELRLSGRSFTIVGVTPDSYPGSIRGLEPDVFVPIMMYDVLEGRTNSVLELRGNQSFFAKGRLASGATLAQAEAVAERVSRDLREAYPSQWSESKAFVLVPTADVIMNPMIDRFILPAAGLLMAVVGLVLLISCANLASFLLARASDRRREIAMRLALGARRRTLVSQLLTEAGLLALVGGAVGVLVAVEALHLLTSADLPLPLPITLDLRLDPVVLGFSLLVSLGAGLLFGLAPALQSSNPDVAPTLRDESTGGGRGRGAALRDLLIMGQVGISVVLLVGAGLFLRSLDASRAIDPGFGTEPTAMIELVLPGDRYSQQEGNAFLSELTLRIGSRPDVEAVGYVDNLHLNQLSTQTARVRVEGVDPPAGEDFHSIDEARADPGFFEAAGIELVAGRLFTTADDAEAAPVAIVNRAFAERFFPGREAVGRVVEIDGQESTVVGVTETTKVRTLSESPRPFVYKPVLQEYSSYITLLARARGEAGPLTLALMEEARGLDPQLNLIRSETLERYLAVLFVGRELGAGVLSGFALLALLLAAIGLYGVVGYAVARRAREVGIRVSLGAAASRVARSMVLDALRLVAGGAVGGLVLAALLSRTLSRLLYGVAPLDPATFVAAPGVLLLVAALAAWIPARRVTRIDPVDALRAD